MRGRAAATGARVAPEFGICSAGPAGPVQAAFGQQIFDVPEAELKRYETVRAG